MAASASRHRHERAQSPRSLLARGIPRRVSRHADASGGGMTGPPRSRRGSRAAPRGRLLLHWVLLALAVAVLTSGLAALKAPSPALFAGLLAGVTYALRARAELRTPTAQLTIGQAIIGVTIGAHVQVSMVETIAARWSPVLLVSLATLMLSLAAGPAMGRLSHVDRVTASFGMIAGGASGLTAVSSVPTSVSWR
jgi:hypothetical protein